VVIANVVSKKSLQMAFVEGDDVVEQIAAAASYPAPEDGKTFISTMRPSALADFYPDSGIQGIAAAVEKMVLEIVNEAK
jgi:hypothetical protein